MFNSFEPVPLPAGGAEGWEKKQTERRKQKCISEYARIAVAPLILRNVAIVSRNGAANRSRKKGGRKIQARMREVFQEEMSKNGGNEGKWNVEEVETEE